MVKSCGVTTITKVVISITDVVTTIRTLLFNLNLIEYKTLPCLSLQTEAELTLIEASNLYSPIYILAFISPSSPLPDRSHA